MRCGKARCLDDEYKRETGAIQIGSLTDAACTDRGVDLGLRAVVISVACIEACKGDDATTLEGRQALSRFLEFAKEAAGHDYGSRHGEPQATSYLHICPISS